MFDCCVELSKKVILNDFELYGQNFQGDMAEFFQSKLTFAN